MTLLRRLRRPLLITGLLSLALAAASLAAVWYVDEHLSEEVVFISPKPAEAVELERMFWEPGQPVADIYGLPASEPARVVMPDQQKLLRPAEDRSLVLMAVDKQAGENPLQVKTLWFLAKRLAAGLSLAGALALAASALGRPSGS